MRNKFLIAALCGATLSILYGCSGSSSSADHDHDEHEHEHSEGLALSGYSTDYEMFTEASPFSIGEPSTLIVHITRLSDFKPVTSGKASADLSVSGRTFSSGEADLSQDGIYSLSILPDIEGEGVLRIRYEDTEFTVPVTVYPDEETAHHEAEEVQAKSGNGVSFTKEKSWKIDFATAECAREPFGQVIKTISKVEPYQGDEFTLVASTDGVVSFSSLVPGQNVSKGQSVCKIISGGIVEDNFEVRLSQAESEYNLARSDYERKLSLSGDRIVSESELQGAKARFESAEAVYESYRRNSSAQGQNVTSCQDGFVRSVSVTNGQYVQAGDPIAVISKSTSVVLKADVQPKYYQALRTIRDASFRSLNSEQIWSLSDLSGKVLGYGRSLQDGSNLIPVSFSVNNRADFLPGSYVETYIRTSSERECLTVPSGAIVEEMGSYFVYVQLTPEFFEKTQVSIGATDGIKTEITSGLKEGTRVVSRGAIIVKLAQSSGGLDTHSGHVH